MESLLSEGFALHTRCSAAAILRPATRVTFFGRSFAPLSRPLMRRRSIHLSPATTSRISAVARNRSLISKSMQSNRGVYSIGGFMTKKEDLIIVKPSTSVDEALEKLVEHRIIGFLVIDDDWTLINQGEFTETAWEAIIGAVDAARTSKQQVVETEHLMNALLEQKDGLAPRIFTKAGVDNTTVLEATDQFISSQPKIRDLGSSCSKTLG